MRANLKRRSRVLAAATAVALCFGCGIRLDNPTTVHDLRVLGMSFDPPDVMMNACTPQVFGLLLAGGADGGFVIPPQVQELLAVPASKQLTFKALIADPAGNGRSLRYELSTCANNGDRECNADGSRIVLWSAELPAGEITAKVMVGAQLMSNGDPLLTEVIKRDPYKGLGGIRVPVVLKVFGPDSGELIYAQKLMVYWCHFFPAMKQNVQPVLPGMTFEGTEWKEDEVREVTGHGPFRVAPLDYAALEESYVVPTLQFKPVTLQESWLITHHTTLGTMSPYQTGGGLSTQVEGSVESDWAPDSTQTSSTDVTFWFTVRDGRGGESWLSRKVRFNPTP